MISDEVYEHMVYAGARHESAARLPGLAARSFIVSSFGKTYHVTGWKVGYVAAPAPLTAEFRKVHQFNVFTVNTPMQHALASYMADPAPYLELPAFYQRKRDLFAEGLAKTRFKLLPSAGTYFQCVDIREVSDLGEADFCQWLTREIGVAAIPLSAFYAEASTSAWCASASPRRTRRSGRHSTGWPGSDTNGRRVLTAGGRAFRRAKAPLTMTMSARYTTPRSLPCRSR